MAQGFFDVAYGTGHVALLESCDGALIVSRSNSGVEREGGIKILLSLVTGARLHLSQPSRHQQRDRRGAALEPGLPDFIFQRIRRILRRSGVQGGQHLVNQRPT
jgi:hypothetical protein